MTQLMTKKIEEKYQKGNKKGHLSYPLSSILRMENKFVVTIIFHGTVYHVPFRFSVAPFFRRKMHHNSKKKSTLFLVNAICITFCVVT